MSERPLKVPARKFHRIFDKDGVPNCLRWTVDDVVEWIEIELKLPQYKECFSKNFITGKKLINVDASSLPRMGITDFEHIKFISAKVREFLGIEKPDWSRSIAFPPKDTMEHFIERKSRSGKESNDLTFDEHVRYLKTFNQHGVSENTTQWTS